MFAVRVSDIEVLASFRLYCRDKEVSLGKAVTEAMRLFLDSKIEKKTFNPNPGLVELPDRFADRRPANAPHILRQ